MATPTSNLAAAPSASSPGPLKRRLARLVASFFTLSPPWSIHRITQQWVRHTDGRALKPVPFQATSDDGLRLECLYVKATATPNTKRLPVLFVHGYLETKERHYRMARLLAADGHDVLLMDLRAHGQSQGDRATFGAKEKHNLTAVLNEAQRRGWLPDNQVITAGLSLGAATVLQHAAIDSRVARVVAIAPFQSGMAAIQSYRAKYFPFFSPEFAQLAFEEESRHAGWRLQDASTLDGMGKIEVPVLLIVGDKDTNLGLEAHTKPLAAAKTKGPCELWIAKGPHHFNILVRQWPGLDEKITQFCA